MGERRNSNIVSYFSVIKDPRSDLGKQHKLIDIIVIAICGVICGAESWVEIEQFGKSKKEWLKQFLELPNGTPSHDTFGRIFAQLNPEAFQKCFLEWVKSVSKMTQGEIISIDGKTCRGSHDSSNSQDPIHLVSAWANANQMVLGQVKVNDKSNEITAIPKLLKMLSLKGSIVTIDAMGCQKDIAEDIISKKADYVLALKGNHGKLFENTKWFFDEAMKNEFKNMNCDHWQLVEKDHGRIETRQCWATADLEWFEERKDWKKLTSIVLIEAKRQIKGKTTIERRYYLSSLPAKAKQLAKAVRAHWGIENSLHWVLDVTFNEDKSRVRKDSAPENFAMIRRFAINLLKQETSTKKSINVKRHLAGWENNYLAKVLFKS